MFFSNGTVNSKGVAILLPKELHITVNKVITDENGHFFLVDVAIEGDNIVIVNI